MNGSSITHTLRSFVSTFLAALAVLSIAYAAQPARAQSDDQLQMRGQIGFGDVVVADRWNPLTVWLSSGAKALDGVLVVKYSQDSSQIAEILTPFATTPGREVPVTVLANVPAGCVNISVRAMTMRGKELRELLFVQVSGMNAPTSKTVEANMPLVSDSSRVVVGVVGDVPSIISSARIWRDVLEDVGGGFSDQSPNRKSDRSAAELFGSIDVVSIPVEQLPRTWMGFDSLAAIVVDPGSIETVDPRVLDALKVWVRSGGHLIVLANQPSTQWQRWVPSGVLTEDPSTAFITTTEPADLRSPSVLSASIFDFVSSASKPKPETVDAQLAETMPARTFQVRARGRSHGWSTRWPIDGDAPDKAGMIAEGSVGFGVVTLLGARPTQMTTVVRDRLSASIWRTVLLPTLSPVLQRIVQSGDNSGFGWYESNFEELQAQQHVVNNVRRAPEIRASIIFWILLVPLAIAISIGFIDAKVLKRLRKREFAWLSAMLWLVALSVIAYLVPAWIRRGPSMSGRVVLFDSVQYPDESEHPLARVTQAVGLYANSSQASPIDDPSLEESSITDQWWRGLPPTLEFDFYGSRSSATQNLIGPKVSTLQLPGTWMGLGGGNDLDTHHVRQWSFRALSALGMARAPVTVDVERTPTGLRVVASGLPTDTKVIAWYLGTASIALEEIEEATEDVGTRVFLSQNSRTSVLKQGAAARFDTYISAFDNFGWSAQLMSDMRESRSDDWETILFAVQEQTSDDGWDRERTIVHRISVLIDSVSEENQ